MTKKTFYRLPMLLALAVLLAWVMPQAAVADNFLQNGNNFTATIMGIDKVQFSLATQYDGNLNEGITDGKVYITIDGGSRQSFLDWKVPNYRDLTSDSESGTCNIKAYVGGTFQLAGKVKGGTKTFTSSDGTESYTVGWNDDDHDHFSTTVVWTAPRSLRGHKLKFEVWAKSEDRDNTWYMPSKDGYREMLTWDCPAAPEVSAQIGDAMLAFDAEHVNQQVFTYSFSARSLQWAKLHYTDAITNKQYTQDLDKQNLVGMTYIPADRPWKDVYVEAHVYDSEGKEVEDNITSERKTTNMMHYPTGLNARVDGKGRVELWWSIGSSELEDLVDGDYFEIQRNVTGSNVRTDANWITISASTPYEQGKQAYTFTDETLMQQYTGADVYYRIRRTYTGMWQWADGSGFSLCQLPSQLVLPAIASATVTRDSIWNDDSHVARFVFELKKEEADTIDNHNRYVLYSARDFLEFANLVNSGQTKLNAVMANDIDISSLNVMIGNTEANAFEGWFFGNGHTLTVNYNTTEQYTAPIRYARNFTVMQLHVAGQLTSSAKYVAGVVGRVLSGTNYIDNCRVSATIGSSVNGDATNGGLVGVNASGELYIDQCRFDGAFTGVNCHSNGGLVGWNDGTVNMYNCLFTPSEISTKRDACQTFSRSRDGSNVKLHNCYYTQAYDPDYTGTTVTIDGKNYIIIRDQGDWNRFRQAVLDAKGNSDVNAIMDADISTNLSCGSETSPYRGIFDGNGHTLNISINTSSDFEAPFRYMTSATIKNLRVTGSVHGGNHTAGLVANIVGSPTVAFKNVWVSASVSTSIDHLGGFVGHSHDAHITIEDCRFDGKLSATASEVYGGAIIGWGHNGSWTFHRVYEYGEYTGIAHAGFSYWYSSWARVWGYNSNSTLCVSAHNWNEMDVAYRGITDQSDVYRWMIQEKSGSWVSKDQKAVPNMESRTFINATYAASYSLDGLQAALGSSWEVKDGLVVPVTSQQEFGTVTTVWDQRAKLQLRINMHGEQGVESMLVDLTDNEDATQKYQFRQELTRKCVDYTFDLILRRGSSPLKINGTEADSLVLAVKKADAAEQQNYRFQNSDRITRITANKKQSSVELTWETSGGDHDYFRVLRRQHTTDANAQWTDTIATNLMQQFYEDKTVLAQQMYDYRVESVYQCEGTNIEGQTCTGQCETTGRIDGYLRMADGTALAGVTVECRPDSTVLGADAVYTTTTDETGYFRFEGLPYQTNGKYYVTVPTTGDMGSYTGPNATGEVSFTPSSNWTQQFNFFMDTYYIYSGNVYYRDTSIPVPGVSFRLDGKLMYDASQHLITTDTQGAFELSIPRGNHSVQAVKAGHYFANDGFLLKPDVTAVGNSIPDTTYNFVKNVASVYLWDSTTVVLRGRVVGGDVEGSKPLGYSQSKNNLGDSLKIVMQLEGDNTSWLIRKQNDETVKSATYSVPFGLAEGDTTRVDVTRHTLTIHPDAKTGEYQIALHPAKYKVTEVSAQGYATLFQQGKVGETVDLSFNVRGDTCEYSRIYHAVPTVEVTQFNARGEKFFGTKTTTATDNIGNTARVELLGYKHTSATDSTACYSFGYPVFMAGSPYGWMLQACEKYYWNNKQTATPDIVNLNGGTVSIKNYLVSNDETTLATTINLDSQGYGSYVFTPANTTDVLEGDDALKSVDITLKYDGNYYDVKPLDGQLMRGFVMAATPKKEGTYTVAASYPVLIDVLRDPPGSGSSSYIEAGSKLSYTYSPTFEGTAGISMNMKDGTYTTTYSGAVQINPTSGSGAESGTISQANSDKVFAFTLASTYNGSWVTSYNVDVTERIQTKTGQMWIGGKADLFMGTNEQIVVQDAIAVRVIPDDQYQLMKTHEGGQFQTTTADGNTATVKVKMGALKVLAKGQDSHGNTVYLVRDEVMGLSNKVKSTFIHSQAYIEDELLPQLAKLRNSLILPKGSVADPQALANQQQKPVYISKVDTADPFFGATDNVAVYFPANAAEQVNQVKDLNQQMGCWIDMLAANEQEKLNVQSANLVKNYDIDGGVASLQYSENFSASRNKSGYIKWPGLSNASLASLFPSWALPAIKDLAENGREAYTYGYNDTDGNSGYKLQTATPVSGFTFKFTPILNFNFQDKSGENKTQSKKVGFTLSTASKASLNVDVYRTRNGQYAISEDDYKDGDGEVYDEMLNMTVDVLDELRYGQPYHPDTDIPVYSSFVFRTRGGVTCQPYEGERRTKWYQPGTVLDVATSPIDQPAIWVDQPVVSNVPFDEPARFVLHMANESNFPDQATLNFKYYLASGSNPKGAKVCVDGKVLNASGESVSFFPVVDPVTGQHNVITKEVTVYPSTAYDYEDLALCLYDPDDFQRVYTVNLSAHFIPSAGKVNVTTPGNSWVMNTESPYDGKRQGYYLPVRIDGFDVNFPGFDHIELQYKLSTQGDKDWVNTCSYYANDSLRAKASGVTDSIPANGIIVAQFFGENDPIEQYYDLRAVNYCRYAGGFLTNSSPILKGIKDTRLPELFGTPEPVNGILGIGDDLKLTFSEPIAGNYLSKINNFELLGTPTNNDISTSTSLTFDGENSLAASQGNRNLAGKSFTVDVMLNPAADKGDMTVFRHGGEENGVKFGLTADRRLSAKVNGQVATSDSIVTFSGILQQVAYVLDQSGDSMTVSFFDGSKQIGTTPLTGKYENTDNLHLGADIWEWDKSYKGDMLEFRLWNRALTASDLSEYGKKQLTGYESGLIDYYRLNEGMGDMSYDRAPGASDMLLLNTIWKRPAGISVKMDGTEGLRLTPDKFQRSRHHDYTLMFWFRLTDSEGTLFSNGEAQGQEPTADGQLNIGAENGYLYVRSDGWQRTTSRYVADGEWHHFCMTVSRSRNVANVYIDQNMVESFVASNLAGISGDHIALGATYVDKNTPTRVMTGNIDEVGMFESVLPEQLLNEFAVHTPIGSLTSLMAYLDFGRSVRQDNNTMRLEPTGISLKRYKDNQGNIVERRDTLIGQIDEHFVDRSIYAPMVSNSQLENLNFSYVASDNQLLVNIKEPDYTIEKTSVYLTVKEVPDLQGNLMASPVTMNVYVYCNPLRWDVKSITRNIGYGEGTTFEATISNQSGNRQTYTLSELPVWITASQTSGTINALDEQTITFTVSPYINIGTYNEQIEVLGAGGMSEPLTLTLNVRGEEPRWAVSDQLKQQNQTMMMVARVKIDGVVAHSEEDMLGVFDENLQSLGVAHIEVDNTGNANEALAYLNIYGYTNPDGTTPVLHFRFFDASTGHIYTVRPLNTGQYRFAKDTIVGSAAAPVEFINEFYDLEWLKLKRGWNWVTFSVTPKSGTTVSGFLDGLTVWEPGDIVMTVDGTTTQQYTCREDPAAPRGYQWDKADEPIEIEPTRMYSIYSMSEKMVHVEGYWPYKQVTVHKDWNRLGYTPSINLPLAQALSGYADEAAEGDVIKSQDAFAVATSTPSGIVWKGSLQYMEVGKGYMLKRQTPADASFYYPLYMSNSRYSGTPNAARRAASATSTTMNIVASVSGIEVAEGDKLVAYLDGERMAECVADDEQLYYLNIGSDVRPAATFCFVMERDGEPVATTGSSISYEANRVIGSPGQPADISFVAIDQLPRDGRWYTTAGIPLAKEPTRSGLYIHNGKVMVKK